MATNEKRDSTKSSPITIVQVIVLTVLYFIENNLYPYALACSFGLLYSAIPLILLLLMILLRILQNAPDFIIQIENFVGNYFDTTSFQDTVSNFFSSMSSSNIFFEIFIGLCILWLARRFFITTMGCVHRIFHTQSTQQPLWIQAVASIFEIVFVLILALLIFATSILHSTIDTSFVVTYFPKLHQILSPISTSLFPLIVVYFVIAIAYKFGSGTYPKWSHCLIAAAACIALFLALQLFFSITLNVDRYNLIYGILAKIIIALFELSFFFTFFLFFAQMLFIVQFFDYLLLAELYLMPEHNDATILGGIHRIVFINPARFVTQKKDLHKTVTKPKNTENFIENIFSLTSGSYIPETEYYEKGDIIYNEGDNIKDIFYIVKGTVELFKTNNVLIKERGSSFGEIGYLLDQPQEHTAQAKTETVVLRISERAFSELLTKNPQTATKALSLVSKRFGEFYPGLRTLT